MLSRHPENVTGLPAGTRTAAWDGRTAQGWGSLADGAQAIINLAGENIGDGRWTDERKLRIRQSRVQAGAAVVEAVRSASVKPHVVIQASAVGYYGPHGDEELNESSPSGQDYLAQVATAWEASTVGVEELGVRRAILRTGIVLSRAGGALSRMLLPFRLFAGGPYGSGRQWFPWIHIADEVGAIRFLACDPDATGPYNLNAPAPLTNREFVKVLGRTLRRPAWLPVPAPALRMLLGEMATLLLDGQHTLPARLQQTGFQFRYPEAGAALRDLLK